jgi:hypothetical protein
MIAPTGALANGVVQGGALAYLLSVQGIGSGGQSPLIVLGIPTCLYFVWSPITGVVESGQKALVENSISHLR